MQAQLPDEWKVQLPEVAVVGSQSSGKSSVLESLVRVLLGRARHVTYAMETKGPIRYDAQAARPIQS